MSPNFTAVLVGCILFTLPVVAFMWWRFGTADTLVFLIVSGLFPAVMDFLSSFASRNYEYPGQSAAWVFTYIFFGWTATCASCMFLAEGILSRPGQDMLTQARLWWEIPLLTAFIAVLLDLLIDPIAVAAGYWVWLVEGSAYYGIPLLNFAGWFVLMLLAPLAWMSIARQQDWTVWKKLAAAFGALPPLAVASVFLFRTILRLLQAFGLH